MNTTKQYLINSKQFAQTIRFLTGMNYVELDHQSQKGLKVYAFSHTSDFDIAMNDIMTLRKKLKK